MSNQELAHAVLGAVGGALALGITYPLITLSTIAQTAAKRRKQKKQAPPRMVKTPTDRQFNNFGKNRLCYPK